MANKDHAYIGDAVYVSHDGYQLWLHLNSHDSSPLIALDKDVMESLIRYAANFFGRPPIKLQPIEESATTTADVLAPEVTSAIETIDAAVFTGDTFENAQAKEQLIWHMGRWRRALGDGVNNYGG